MKDPHDFTFEPFNRDVAANAGYLYTTDSKLSSQMANRRLSDASLMALSIAGKRVIDIGCGDGSYTLELFDRGTPASMCGVDPAEKAIEVALQRVDSRGNITFAVNSGYELPYEKDSFDIAYVRGVLHHVEQPMDVLREALRVAPTLLIIEPNGYNPILKLIERFSRYHREHHEKSYTAARLESWIRSLGGEVRSRQWVGLVPFFCPDWMARSLKMIEPVIEDLPLARTCACAVCVMVVSRLTEHQGGK